jgi:hypothetical protein
MVSFSCIIFHIDRERVTWRPASTRYGPCFGSDQFKQIFMPPFIATKSQGGQDGTGGEHLTPRN